MFKQTLLLILLLGVTPLLSQAVVEQPKSLFSAGGARMTGGIYEINGNVGDVISGISLAPGGSTIIEHGFWAGNTHQLLDVNDEPRVTFVTFLGTPEPNPAKTQASIEFGLPTTEHVTLAVYDVSGRRVQELINRTLNASVFRKTWDLRNQTGNRVSPGVYFYKLRTSSFSAVRRVVVLD